MKKIDGTINEELIILPSISLGKPIIQSECVIIKALMVTAVNLKY